MENESVNKALDVASNSVQDLTSAIKQIAPDAWNIAVQQQINESIIQTVIGATIILLSIIGGKYFRNLLKKNDARSDDIIGVTACVCVVAVVGIVIMVFGILGLLNPEYYAMRDFIEVIN